MRSDRDTGYGVDYFTRDHPWLGRWYVPLCEWERTMGIERNFRDRDSLRVPDGIFLGASASNVEHDTAVETVKARTAEYRSKCSDYADWLKAQELLKQARYRRNAAMLMAEAMTAAHFLAPDASMDQTRLDRIAQLLWTYHVPKPSATQTFMNHEEEEDRARADAWSRVNARWDTGND